MTLICILGKFETASRRSANVTVDGNSVYVSIDNFRKYANYHGFFAYEYDNNTTIKENVTDKNVTTNNNINNTVGQVYRLAKKTKLYANSNMNIAYNYKKGTKVTVLENVTKNIDKVKINITGLIRYVYNTDYTNTKNIVTTNTVTNTVSNKTYRTTQKTKMYANANLTKAYNYLKNTKVTLLSKSNNIAKVRVNKTNLIRYINMKYLK